MAINPWRHSNFPSRSRIGWMTIATFLSVGKVAAALIEKQGKSETDRLRCEKRVSEKIADDDHPSTIAQFEKRGLSFQLTKMVLLDGEYSKVD